MTEAIAAETPSSSAAPKSASSQSSIEQQLDVTLLKSVPVTISVEVGRSMLKISDLLRLTQGSVVELDRIAGEPLDLLVHNTVIAQGEVVLVNDRYGIRLTRVVTAAERLKNL